MKPLLSICLASMIMSVGCQEDFDTYEYPTPPPPPEPPAEAIPPEARYYHRVETNVWELTDDEEGNIIPDFSRVGYQWGDKPIPVIPVVKTLESHPKNADGTRPDTYAEIQAAINEVAALPPDANGHRGAILLKGGTWEISQTLTIPAGGIVLRGEGNTTSGTVLDATKPEQHSLIKFTGNTGKTGSASGNMNILDEYVPVGRFWVRVSNPKDFKVGDDVMLHRPASQQWISDIKMDKITAGPDIQQWQASGYVFDAERVITMISGDTLHFDNPCVMAIEAKYGGGAVYKYSYRERLSECGVENMLIRSKYNGNTDENHGWRAIEFSCVQHSWVKDVHTQFFGYSLVTVAKQSKNITIQDCESRDMKSQVTGGRRYSFEINGSLCLVINCTSKTGRHDFVVGPRQCGPNVFVNCTATASTADSGPHHRWNMGTLFDNVATNWEMAVQDRDKSGSGHGWSGANQVFWNSRADRGVCVQSPWVSAKNYSIGMTGPKKSTTMGVSDRPDGVWVSAGTRVTPGSLYEEQLRLRKAKFPGGVFSIR